MQRIRVVVLASVLTMAITATADAQFRSPLRAGVSLGAATSNLGGDDFIASNSRWGFIGGAFVIYKPSSTFSLGLEANYIEKGGNNVAFTIPARDVSTKYIELPLTVGYVFGMSQGWDGRIYSGIDLAFLLSCNATSEAGDESCEDSPLVPKAKSTEWSIPFGVQLAYYLGGSALALDVRYSLGLSNTFDTFGAGANLKSRSWQFKLMWFFPLGEN